MSKTATSFIVTLDGPAASGKSSVSRALAARLGWRWISTGAFYRGLAYVALLEKTTIIDLPKLAGASNIWSVRADDDLTRVFYRGQDVTREVLSEENGSRASLVSQIPEVRQALLQNQRDQAHNVKGLVAEGRDCGSVVFPQALLKVYLTASSEERAARRAREQGLDLKATQDQQKVRDTQDTQRAAAPLQVPPGARVVDSNGLNLEDVVERIYQWVLEAQSESSPPRQ